MTSRSPTSRKFRIDGPAGILEGMEESPPGGNFNGVALLCHPHPLHGGTMENKVVHTLAQSFVALGAKSVRFNYRGVGASEGSYGEGVGETEDAVAVARQARRGSTGRPFYLGGFSFGALVALRATRELKPDGLVTVAPPVQRVPPDLTQPRCPWLIIQGDEDDVVSADDVVGWANSLEPGPELRMMHGAGHFFHGRLIEIRDTVVEFFERQRVHI